MKSLSLLRILIVVVLLIIVGIQALVVKHLQGKIDNVTILTCEGDAMLKLSPEDVKKPMVLIDPEMIDMFNKYKSPFNDGLSFNELLEKYIRNRWSDHYGAARGSRDCKRIHEGVDLFVPINTPVYPLTGYGIVTEVSDDPHYLVDVECKRPNDVVDTVKIEYGKTIRILYPEGIESIYTHLNEVYVSLGQEVDGDTKVGLTGDTGNIRRSGKPSHLHMELRDSENKSFDPRNRLRFTQASMEYFLKHLALGVK